MQYFFNFFTYVDQCCDASFYLRYGLTCADTGACYDDVRPMGAVYWFSIPYRLGLSPAATLISAHLVLAALSIMLSVLAMRKFLPASNSRPDRTALYLLFAGSLLCHLVFLYPLLRVSLSDAPGSLLFLIAIWLLFLAPADKQRGFIVLAFAGLCLGLSAWVRSFFLYPVLVLVIAGLLVALRKRNLAVLGLLLALLPISIQFQATWNRTGHLSYIHPTASSRWTATHLNSEAIGYDTLVPAKGYYWYSSCDKYLSLVQALYNGDLRSLYCLLSGRLNFYLGSYSAFAYPPVEYSDPRWGNNLLPAYQDAASVLQNMQRTENDGMAPDDTTTAHRLSKPDKKSYGEISQTLMLQASVNPYEFSTWAWSFPSAHTIAMSVRHHDSKQVVAEKIFVLPVEKEIQVLKGVVISQTGYYDVVLSSPAMQSSDIFVWENFDLRMFMLPEKPLHPASIRYWSGGMLAVNCLACLGAIFFILKQRKHTNIVQQLAPLLVLLSCGMALLVIPEQRFVIAPLIAIWVFFITLLVTRYAGNRHAALE